MGLKWLLARAKMVILRQKWLPPPLNVPHSEISSDLYHLKFQVLEEEM